MKKVLLIVFGSIAALGLVLGIIGFAMGGALAGFVFNNGRMYYGDRDIGEAPNWLKDADGTWYWFGWNSYENDDLWDEEDREENLTTSSGEVATIKAPADLADLEGIAIDVSAGYLTFKVAERDTDVGLVVKGPLEAKSRYENGVWRIESKLNMNNVRTSSENWKSYPRFYRGGQDITTEYILTLPEEFGELTAGLEMGLMKADGLTLETAKFSQNLGAMKIVDCKAESTTIDMDLGGAEFVNYEAEDIEMIVNLGGIDFDGSIEGTLKAKCDLGGINCTLDDPGDYGYKVDVSLGGVTIGGDGAGGAFANGKSQKDSRVLPFYDVECGLGGVDIQFR